MIPTPVIVILVRITVSLGALFFVWSAFNGVRTGHVVVRRITKTNVYEYWREKDAIGFWVSIAMYVFGAIFCGWIAFTQLPT